MRLVRTRFWLCRAALLLGIAVVPGCALLEVDETDYETVQVSPLRDAERAQRLTHEAAQQISAGRLDRAEQVLQKALVADVTYGPAHNNLGRIYYERNQLYLAAWEFEYASRLMPRRAEPLNNLGLVYEAIRRYPEAIGYFEDAYAIDPEHPNVLSNLTRVRVRTGEVTPETEQLLSDVALRNDLPQWREWALENLATSHVALTDVGHAVFAFPTAPEPILPLPMSDSGGLGPHIPDWSSLPAADPSVDDPPSIPLLSEDRP